MGWSILNISVWVCVVYFSIGLDLAALGSNLILDYTCMYLIDDACSSFQPDILDFCCMMLFTDRQRVSALMGAYDPVTI